MVYVGQTTQYSTFRWYQHFKRPYSGSKFHNAILEHDLSDWTFQVIEIINDKNGILISNSADELYSAMKNILEKNVIFDEPEELHDYIQKHFSINIIAQKFDEIYQQILR